MEVKYDPYVEAARVKTLDEPLLTTDIHAARAFTEETRKMISARQIALLPRGSYSSTRARRGADRNAALSWQ
jgi:phosphoglycerate dehydrogenase-like enzyme